MRDREGDHNGRFILPDGRQAHATLTLAADAPSTVSLHPDTPTPIGPEGRGFPENSHTDALVGRLFSNEEVIVGDVHLSEWVPEQMHASGRWVLIGLSITQVLDGRWSTVRVRLTGLEAVLGNAISAILWPKDSATIPQRFSASITSAESSPASPPEVVLAPLSKTPGGTLALSGPSLHPAKRIPTVLRRRHHGRQSHPPAEEL